MEYAFIHRRFRSDPQRLALGLERGENSFPLAICVGDGGLLVDSQSNGYLCLGFGRTPHGNGVTLLQHHVTAENGRKLHLSLQIQADQKKKRRNGHKMLGHRKELKTQQASRQCERNAL